ncbi:DNA recombination-mediator protein A [Arthrobacter sp. cf158]|nr:DNA recombination-mediator protein A [Arthrobacter sp. cf158]
MGSTVDPEKDLAAIERLGGGFLIPGDEHWPEGLDDLPDAPYGLWYRGNIDNGIPVPSKWDEAFLRTLLVAAAV